MPREASVAQHEAAIGAGIVLRPRGGRFEFLTITQLKARPLPAWRIVKVIPARGLVVLWGAPGSGKSFVLDSMFLAGCRGAEWFGHRTSKGVFVLIGAEGSRASRLQAAQEEASLDDEDLYNLRVLETRIDLLDPTADLPDLLEDLQRIRSELGPIAVVAIDTLNRAMPGGNENAAEDMGAMVSAAKSIEERFECAVIYVHHAGKDESKGSRGHSSLRAAADTELSVRRLGNGPDAVREVVVEKMRDAEDGNTLLSFRLKQVDLGPATDVDPHAGHDERITSCVVAPVYGADKPAQPRRKPTGANQRLLLQALERAVSLHGKTVPGRALQFIRGVTIDELREEAASQEFSHVDAKHRATRFTDALSGLKAAGFVKSHDNYLWPSSSFAGTGGYSTETPGLIDREGVSGVSRAPNTPEAVQFGDSGVSGVTPYG